MDRTYEVRIYLSSGRWMFLIITALNPSGAVENAVRLLASLGVDDSIDYDRATIRVRPVIIQTAEG